MTQLQLIPTPPKPLKKAEEVFLIVRELARAKASGKEWRYATFRWKTWHDACVAVLGPTRNLKGCFKSTVGNMLRAQVRKGYIARIRRGVYQFRSAVPAYPLYVAPGLFNMTPNETRGRAERPRFDVSVETKARILRERFA